MADPMRILYEGGLYARRVRIRENAAILVRQDPLSYSARLIARNNLRIWFEPDWYLARRLAAMFPSCLICSIPVESDTPNLYKTPGWRIRRQPPPPQI
jgi:hypothetical protein